MTSMFDESVEMMMRLSIGSSFVWNDSVMCVIEKAFTDWHKDCNSPTEFSEAKLKIKLNWREIPGLIVVQRDPALSQKYYASLCIKQPNEAQWQSMFTVNKITFI